MEKAKGKCRDIHFYSKKNQTMICVHSRETRAYAQILEHDPDVIAYEAGKELDTGQYRYIDPVDIRKDYFETAWATDFVIHYAGGKTGVREIVTETSLDKRAVLEKLEFSRRYWVKSRIENWKIVIIEKGV